MTCRDVRRRVHLMRHAVYIETIGLAACVPGALANAVADEIDRRIPVPT